MLLKALNLESLLKAQKKISRHGLQFSNQMFFGRAPFECLHFVRNERMASSDIDVKRCCYYASSSWIRLEVRGILRSKETARRCLKGVKLNEI